MGPANSSIKRIDLIVAISILERKPLAGFSLKCCYGRKSLLPLLEKISLLESIFFPRTSFLKGLEVEICGQTFDSPENMGPEEGRAR